MEPSLDSIQPNADKATGIEKYIIARIVDEDQSVENYTKDDIMQSAFVFALGHINSDLSMYCVLYVSIQDSLGYSRRDMGERERSRWRFLQPNHCELCHDIQKQNVLFSVDN